MKTWQNRAGGSREDYDEVLARKVLKGGQGRSSDWCQGEDGKGKERESSTFTSTSAEGQGEAEGESESQINQLPDLIILAGFMHILSPNFLEIISKASSKPIPCINLHPALPSQFDGAQAIERAFKAFQDGKLKDDTTGVMIHKVVAEVDRGMPIVTEEIKMQEGETLESLKVKVAEVEHRLIVEGARRVLEE